MADDLTAQSGYTKSDLEDAIKQEGGGDDAQKDPENALFECTTVTGKIDMLEWCFNGCVETGAAGHNDACASKFYFFWRLGRLLNTRRGVFFLGS